MLAEIAHEGFKNDELFFDKQKIVRSIVDFLSDSVDNPKYLDGQKILNAIAAQQGILIERAENVYSFSHLTLQEYLTTQYISQKDSRIEELVTKHLTDERWREVFLLVAGLKDDAGDLLQLMETATQKFINTDKLHNLLVWVKYRTNHSSGDIQPVGKRAMVFANAFFCVKTHINFRIKSYIINDNFTIGIADAIAQAYITSSDISKASVIPFAFALVNAFTHANNFQYQHTLDEFTRYVQWSKNCLYE